jgi:hypothetical protein
MNESEFENKLRHEARPAKPSVDLASRIEAELARPIPAGMAGSGRLPRSSRSPVLAWLGRLSWAAAGAVAALVATAPWAERSDSARQERPMPATSGDSGGSAFEIVDASRELVGARDEGLQIIDESEAQRRLRLSYIERLTWTNPETGAMIAYETPREGVMFMPVALQ